MLDSLLSGAPRPICMPSAGLCKSVTLLILQVSVLITRYLRLLPLKVRSAPQSLSSLTYVLAKLLATASRAGCAGDLLLVRSRALMMPAQDREDDVAVGAAKYSDPTALGTHAPSFSESMKKPYRDLPSEPFVDEKEWPRWSFWRAGIAEFMSSLLFLYVTVQTVIGQKRFADPCRGVGTQGIAWAFGGMIFVLVYCTAGISGGHINPAVTFALFLARKVSFNRAVYYIVCQCLGAICGAGIVKGFQPSFYQTAGGGANTVAHGYTKGGGLGAEIVGTFLLVYVVFAATDAKRKARDSHVPALVPLPIGFAVYLVHLATIPITGTGINPARSLGAAVIFNTQHNAWADHWIFWVGPLTGAALAAAYYQLIIRALPFRKAHT